MDLGLPRLRLNPLPTQELFVNNSIDKHTWAGAVYNSIDKGRSKGTAVCHAGLAGDEGKSFLLAPLVSVFGIERVFTTPGQSGFPLVGLPGCRVALLDDWRFNEQAPRELENCVAMGHVEQFPGSLKS